VGTQPNSRRLTRNPKYVTIRNLLRDRILAGGYGLGNRLPSESALMSQFAVSRVTVRLALGALREVGLVESRQGKGHFVRPVRAIQDLGRLQGFGEMMAAVGVEARSSVLSVAETPASAEVARALRVERAVPVIAIHRVRIGGGTPLSYDVSYFPVDIGRRLTGQDLAHADIFALLEERLGVDLAYADLMLEIAAADETVAPHLGVRLGEPLIRITRLTHDHNGRPIDFEYLYGRQDSFQFRIRVPRW
jgi:GntR family transcriptional regulator